MHLDEANETVLRMLQDNSRVSFVELGAALGISESAVRRRVKSLVDGGVIRRFTVELGDRGTASAVVLASVDSGSETSEVASRLLELPGAETIYEITGQYDIMAVITAPSIGEINSSIDGLRKVPGVTNTNTVIILRRVRRDAPKPDLAESSSKRRKKPESGARGA